MSMCMCVYIYIYITKTSLTPTGFYMNNYCSWKLLTCLWLQPSSSKPMTSILHPTNYNKQAPHVLGRGSFFSIIITLILIISTLKQVLIFNSKTLSLLIGSNVSIFRSISFPLFFYLQFGPVIRIFKNVTRGNEIYFLTVELCSYWWYAVWENVLSKQKDVEEELELARRGSP